MDKARMQASIDADVETLRVKRHELRQANAQVVVTSHAIEQIEASIERKRAALRRFENADRRSGRRTAGNTAGMKTGD